MQSRLSLNIKEVNFFF